MKQWRYLQDSAYEYKLLVVGEQSRYGKADFPLSFADRLGSGKSSVLKGLTGLPFPRDKGLCTRFATQILFKRVPVQNTVVSIIPDKDADKDHADKVKAWRKDELQGIDRDAFKSIMVEVSFTS